VRRGLRSASDAASGLADVACAEGVTWIHLTLQLQLQLPSEFHTSFREAVPAHLALLAG
jgi:hypothetical protein